MDTPTVADADADWRMTDTHTRWTDSPHNFYLSKPNAEHGNITTGAARQLGRESGGSRSGQNLHRPVNGMLGILTNLDGIYFGLLSAGGKEGGRGGLGTCSFRSVRLQAGKQTERLRVRDRLSSETDLNSWRRRRRRSPAPARPRHSLSSSDPVVRVRAPEGEMRFCVFASVPSLARRK